MAKSTFLTICQTVQRECLASGNPMTTTVGATGEFKRIVEWVKQADKEIQSRWFNWDFLWVGTWASNTVAGTQNVSAPVDIGTWDTDSFFLDYSTANWKKLTFVEYRDWRTAYRQGVKTNQQPAIVTIMPDRSLKLEGPPDKVYSLTADYWKRPLPMALDADTSQIPEEFERIIIARAKMFYAEYESASEIMQSAQIEHDDLLDKLEAQYMPDQQLRRLLSTGEVVARAV
jgi:hypothetical protein